MNPAELKTRVENIREIATLPSVITELMGLLDDPNVSLRKLGSIVEADPALTVKVLRVANSPFYGIRGRIHTIQQAVALLGLTEFNNLLVSISLFSKLFNEKSRTLPQMSAYWDHSIACALISRTLVSKLFIPTGGREFTAGLLHDIGKLVLLEHFPSLAVNVQMKMFNEQKTDIQAEQEFLGVTHSEIGGWIAEKWRLPVSYVEVVKYHHSPALAQLNKSLVAVTQVANLISKQFDPAAQRYPQPTEPITETAAWQILKKENPSVQHVNLEQIMSEITLAADATKTMMSQMTGGK